MEISDEERRILEELQHDLDSEDPEFSRRMEGKPFVSRRNMVIGILLGLAGVFVLLSGVTLNSIWLGLGGFVMMFYGTLLAIPRMNKRDPPWWVYRN